MSKPPLSGIKVLDLGRMFAAPWAGQMLADLGADVVKVERPRGGDLVRAAGPPFLKDANGQSTPDSSFYLAANRNKRSITVDFTKPEGRDIVRRLAADADILIENFKVGDLQRYGLDYDSLHEINPQLIYCSITGFGPDGPYAQRPGVDSVIQALSGLMSVSGEPDGEPQKSGITIVDLVTGYYATIAILAALNHRTASDGQGQRLEIALLDCAIALMSHRAMEYLMTGEIPMRVGSGAIAAVPARNFACRGGGLINIQAGSDENFRRLAKGLGHEELSADPRFARRRDRIKNKAELFALLEEIFLQRTAHEWFDTLAAHEVLCGPVNNLAQAFDDPQVRFRGMRREAEHATAGTIALVANPMRFSQTPAQRCDAPPTLGQNTEEVLRQSLGMSREEIAALRAAGAI